MDTEKKRIFKQEVEPSGKEAKKLLNNFLQKNRDAVHALRSFCQILDGGFRFDDSRIDFLKELIQEKSSGSLNWTDGLLCQIGNKWEIFQHERGEEQMEWNKGINAIRGFWFHFQVNGYYFECVDLDAGQSREYFDSMTQEQKSDFISRFANRDRGLGQFLGDPKYLPLAFTAFITDESKDYLIEKIIPYHHFGPEVNVLGVANNLSQ